MIRVERTNSEEDLTAADTQWTFLTKFVACLVQFVQTKGLINKEASSKITAQMSQIYVVSPIGPTAGAGIS
jgi:hypothetical protein